LSIQQKSETNMAFLPIEKTTPLRLTIPHFATILVSKAKLAFSRPAKNPQDAFDAQLRREAARRSVDNLLR
jgi:hypothetical protein